MDGQNSTIERIKRFSKKFKGSKSLCGKSWALIDDSEQIINYVFLQEGKVYIIKNEKKIIGKWSWLEANSFLAIEEGNEAILLNPAYVDNSFIAFYNDSKLVLFIESSELLDFDSNKHGSKVNQYLQAKFNSILKNEREATSIFNLHTKLYKILALVICFITMMILIFINILFFSLGEKIVLRDLRHIIFIILCILASMLFIFYVLKEIVYNWGIIKKWFLKPKL